MARASRRPKGFGLFDTGAPPVRDETPNLMPTLDSEELSGEWHGPPELERAMRERKMRFKKNGASRVEVGRGAFAKAFLAESTIAGSKDEFVIKEVDLAPLKEAQRKKASLEVTFLKSLNHVNVIRCLDAFNTANVLHIVLEYASGGTLAGRIDEKKAAGGLFAPEEVLRWFAHLCAALRHLHSARVLHRDLKTANVFLDYDARVKLGDFGLSRKLEDDENFSGQMVGTPYYFAPEVVTSKPFSNKTDVWSAAVIAYELAFLKKPFQGKSLKGLYRRIADVQCEAMPETADPRIRRLVSSILKLEPSDRPSASRLCKDADLAPYVEREPTAELERAATSVPASSPPPSSKKKSKAVSKMLLSVSGLAPPVDPPAPAVKEKCSVESPAASPAKEAPLALPSASPKAAPAVAGGAGGQPEAAKSDDEDDYCDDFEDGASDESFEDADDNYEYEDDFESYDDSLVAVH